MRRTGGLCLASKSMRPALVRTSQRKEAPISPPFECTSLHLFWFYGLSKQHEFVSGWPAIVRQMKLKFLIRTALQISCHVRNLDGLRSAAFDTISDFVRCMNRSRSFSTGDFDQVCSDYFCVGAACRIARFYLRQEGAECFRKQARFWSPARIRAGLALSPSSCCADLRVEISGHAYLYAPDYPPRSRATSTSEFLASKYISATDGSLRLHLT